MKTCQGEAALKPTLLILGPLRLRGDAGDVWVGGARPRRLLAVLAAHAGESVTADSLIDAVWGETPPRSARQNLHTYLWQLRRSAEQAAGGRIIIATNSSGFVLRAAPGEVDWDCFRESCAGAAAVLPAEPGKGRELLARALSLWRGDVLADVAGELPMLAPRIAAMQESRMAAVEQRIDADLQAGLDRELVGELAELVAEHPLREQLRAQQMVALYRCGRQADALRAYHGLRRDLAAELGVDPSPKLRALFEAMLRADTQPSATGAALRPPGERMRAAPGRAPGGGRALTLGQRAAGDEARAYQGRRAELARFQGMLDAQDRLPRLVRLHGPAGIGKTAFACTLARKCHSRGWPAVIIDSRDFRHDAASLSEIVSARLTAERSRAASQPLLLVFDTFEEMGDIERDLWDIILPGMTGPVLVVLSGRHPASIRAARGCWDHLLDDIELSGLSDAEARGLIRFHGVTDSADTAKILAFAVGNPLLLTLGAQHAKSAGGGEVTLAGAAAQSIIGRITREITDPDLRRPLEAASLVRTFNEELLAEMTGRDAGRDYAALCRLSFVRAVPRGARVHDLVRESVAADLARRVPEACQLMRGRAHDYLVRQAQSAAEPGSYIQELLHLAAGGSATARFYAPSDWPQVHVRAVSPEDMPRLRELCHAGITRFGIPPAERVRQLEADFPVARHHFAVAEDDAGNITGFAYTVVLNNRTWRAAATTRRAFFARLPERELAAIRTAPEGTNPGFLVTGATHLPGHDHVSAALREYLFPKVRDGRWLASDYTAYHLLAADCPELPEIITAGLIRRAANIRIGGCMVDEWLLRFGAGGLVGWLAEASKSPITGA